MSDKPIYGMSSVGDCSRVLSAMRLGYEAVPQSQDDLDRLNHYTRCEALAGQQILDMGFRVEPSTLCQHCKDEFGIERHGIHVEKDTSLFRLIGHLDRRVILDSGWKLPVEIKSLGPASWSRFAQHGFDDFPQYAAQEACYLSAESSPGIYWVMRRDDGKSLKYIVNDIKNEIDLPNFKKIKLPITFSEIVNRLNDVEIYISEGILPLGEEDSNCWFCRYKFLCVKDEEKSLQLLNEPDLVRAAEDYKDALELESVAKSLKSDAVTKLVLHSKTTKIDKYRVSGISFTYRGQKVKEFIDSKLLKQHHPDIYQTYLKTSEPYDDYTIRRLKG